MTRPFQAVTAFLLTLVSRLRDRDDRGDVPGWVMIAVMTAALVVALLAAVSNPLKSAVTNAISSVTSATG